ncbi:MAG: SHOCT domain-containing protein [Candidatus Scalindua sp.]|nr:SHOCT domain-containing protein [Candidatus Scalindua sp.]
MKKVEHRKSTKTKKHSEIGTELSKLSVLKDKGVLTQEEYNRAKEKLLK